VDQELSNAFEQLDRKLSKIIALLEEVRANTWPLIVPFETVEGVTDATPPTATQLHYVPLEKDDE